jgi:sulfate adenylyltransferase
MHKSHFMMTKMALERIPNSNLLIHPVVGMTKFGDIDYPVRVKCYQKVLDKYDGLASLSLLPLAMRMAGPREAIWHALIRKNYGCTHFIVGRDHAGPGKNKASVDFYDPYAAQVLCKKYEDELGIRILTFNEIGYVKELEQYVELSDNNIEMIKSNNYTILNISGTQFRHKLNNNEEIPEWFAFPEVVDLLRQKFGLVIFMTGLSGAGKSTIAYYLQERLLELTNNKITILDGDEIRENLSKGLSFSKEDRDTNIKRIGYVASLISKHGGISIVPCIAPYNETRQYFRSLCEKEGQFIEIYVSTPLSVCEERDVKGLYKEVRKGKIKNFTGIDDPYEIPTSSDIVIDTTKQSILETIDIIMKHIPTNF